MRGLPYQWILETASDGPAPLDRFALAGDSAGGNLVLMLANWAREHTNRQADAIVALSPITDSTLSSASLKENLATDHMLRPMVAPILKAPKLLLLPAIARQFGIRPSDPDISPIHDDLSGLPPIFIQASSTEVLHDDAVRFSNKANWLTANRWKTCGGNIASALPPTRI